LSGEAQAGGTREKAKAEVKVEAEAEESCRIAVACRIAGLAGSLRLQEGCRTAVRQGAGKGKGRGKETGHSHFLPTNTTPREEIRVFSSAITLHWGML
jgi:hypothetical protein